MQFEEDRCRIFVYGLQSHLTAFGKFNAKTRVNGKQNDEYDSHSVGYTRILLNFATASKLDLVDVEVRSVTTETNLIEQYPNVFKGIRKLKNNEVQLHIDDTVQPVVQSA